MIWQGDLTLGFLVRGRFDSGDFAMHTAAGALSHDADLSEIAFEAAMVPDVAGPPDYRWRMDGIVSEASGLATSGAPDRFAPSIVPVNGGACAEFATAQLTVENAPDINSGVTTRRSWSLWMRADRLGDWRCLWEEGATATWAGLYLEGSNATFVVGSGNDLRVACTAPIAAGVVYHVAATADFSTTPAIATLYLNGQQVDVQTFTTGSFGSHGGDIHIGGEPDARDSTGSSSATTAPFVGRIQDVALWTDAVLSAPEVSAIHAAGAGDPVTYLGGGPFLRIGESGASAGEEKPGLTLTLAGADPEVIALAELEPVQRRRVTIYLAQFDAEGGVARTGVFFDGLADTIETNDDPENPTAVLSCESRALDLQRPRPFKLLPEDQRARAPGDTFFDLVAQIQNRDEEWGQ
jgi:hypothetical protein